MSPTSTSPVNGPHSTPGFLADSYGTGNEYLSPEEQQRSQLEDKLEQLLQTLLEVGICTSDVQENAREGARTGKGEPFGSGGLVGKKINESINLMAELYDLNANLTPEIPIPIEVIQHVDQGTNPDRWLKSFVERAVHENMYTNGILSNINEYNALLKAQLAQNFPELSAQFEVMQPPENTASISQDTPTNTHNMSV
ncbi:hypothetical protein CROQUDRAFT_660379 [Cronartium quercuum f. sp. fusiforme G11]|uniref:Mediator of RNA polymerase II transcription subunit 10 n=1 Tax=Cronartium quercuum f. sp. fusiforme G11 TaxID=708437 RepID=A0A9P6NIB1_9BASI|nr:hypothetical protein CROQUDRAFT_660379 [Cronartium quercuum f. sp. fusiforme G11]